MDQNTKGHTGTDANGVSNTHGRRYTQKYRHICTDIDIRKYTYMHGQTYMEPVTQTHTLIHKTQIQVY
jgi:hypothetical protein